MNEKSYRRFEAAQEHVRNLKRLFPKLRRLDDAEVLAKLSRLEAKQSRNAVAYCNGWIQMDEYDRASDQVRDKVIELLGDKVKPILKVNGDPRGYAIKFDEEWSKDKTIYRDLGGWGILAPEF